MSATIACVSRWARIAVLLALLGAFTAAASARVPAGFVGMDVGGPFFYPDFDQTGQMNLMRADGVRTVSTLFDWESMQPYKSFSQVPAGSASQFQNIGGVPTDFASADAFVTQAASHHMTVLPVVEYAPQWDARNAGNSGSPPRSDAPYGAFMRALVNRYGPSGSFWRANPSLPREPIRAWQIWNEPNFTEYWDEQPFESSYVRLLKVAHQAVKSSDHGAEVVLAGLTNTSWVYLADIYRIKGARSAFDAVAAHPYTAQPSGVVTILGYLRAVMRKHGDGRKPIIASEISWPSAAGKATTKFENSTTEAGQAKKVSQAIAVLARDRKRLGLQAFYYYTWIGNETMPSARADPFNFAGLERFIDGVGIEVKPALKAFAKAVASIER